MPVSLRVNLRKVSETVIRNEIMDHLEKLFNPRVTAWMC